MTMRRSRILFNTLLALAAIGLAAGLWLARGPAPPPALPTLSSIAPNAIDHITVRHGSELIVLERGGPDRPWRLVSPVKARPDPTQVAILLALARTQATHAYPLQVIADRTTGLSKMPLTVRFNDEAPVRLGAAGPEPDSRYVATAYRLLLARLPDTRSLTRSWSHWIDPALVAPNTRLTRLVLPDFTLTRDTAGLWHASPIHQRSDAAARATISAWKRVKALTVVPADRSRKRIARITMDFADAKPRHLDVIERNPNLILRDPRLQVDYHLAGNRVPPLLELEHPGIPDY
jgi:hypothetical protein